jgi:FkbM family methyltransferase
MKQIIKNMFDQVGLQVSKKQPWMNNYTWIKSLDIKSVIDVGANIGQYSLFMSKLLPHAKIHAFEPVPPALESLKQNTLGKNITIHPFALSDEHGRVSMNLNDFGPSSSMLPSTELLNREFPQARKTTAIEIETRRFDELVDVATLDREILVKIDVQGVEDKVIRGATGLMQAARAVICEASFVEIYAGQTLFDDIYMMLREFGYRFYGHFDQQYDRVTGRPIYADAIFIRE